MQRPTPSLPLPNDRWTNSSRDGIVVDSDVITTGVAVSGELWPLVNDISSGFSERTFWRRAVLRTW
jgi:hypothetical protein